MIHIEAGLFQCDIDKLPNKDKHTNLKYNSYPNHGCGSIPKGDPHCPFVRSDVRLQSFYLEWIFLLSHFVWFQAVCDAIVQQAGIPALVTFTI